MRRQEGRVERYSSRWSREERVLLVLLLLKMLMLLLWLMQSVRMIMEDGGHDQGRRG